MEARSESIDESVCEKDRDGYGRSSIQGLLAEYSADIEFDIREEYTSISIQGVGI